MSEKIADALHKESDEWIRAAQKARDAMPVTITIADFNDGIALVLHDLARRIESHVSEPGGVESNAPGTRF